MLIVFQRGSSVRQNANVSVTSRIEGPGGKMYVPRAMYSLRMSFWIVPRSRSGSHAAPARPPRTSASRMAAVALIVIEVVTSPGVDPVEEGLHVVDRVDRHADRPTSPAAIGSSES